MQLKLNNIPVQDIVDNRSLYDSYPDMDFELDVPYNILEQYYSQEGLVWDVAKGLKSGVSAVRKAGRSGYRMMKTGHRNLKDKWNKIKPIIIKALKDLGINLYNMYGRFMKYSKDYEELGKRIDNVIQTKVPLLSSNKDIDILIDMYDINVNNLSNICKTVESYGDFLALVDNNLLDNSFIEPKDFVKLVESNVNKSTGEVRTEAIRSKLQKMTEAIGELNSHGEMTIPEAIYRERKWVMPNGVPFTDKRSKRKEINEKMDDSTVAGFVKLSITGHLEELTISGENIDEFKKLLVGNSKNGYLHIMKDFLNNRIIENTLKKSGSTMKKETREFYNIFNRSIDMLNKILEDTYKAKANRTPEEDMSSRDQEDPRAYRASTGELQRIVNNKNKKLSNTDDGNIEAETDSLDALIDSYSETMTSFFINTSTVYASMVNGLTAASFEIIVNCKNIVDKIESLSSTNKKVV